MIHLYAISILVSQLKLSDNMSRSDSRRRRGRSCSILPISHCPLILYMTFKGFKSNSQEGVLKETRHVVINPNLAAVFIASKDQCNCTQTYRGKEHRISRGHVANTRCGLKGPHSVWYFSRASGASPFHSYLVLASEYETVRSRGYYCLVPPS